MSMKNNIHDYRTDTDKFFGIYRGVVEDRYDKELLGRCRVRVLGVHDEEKQKGDVNGIPTEELPWAEPCYTLSEGQISGNGHWVVPLQGTYVFVFFENGNWMQPRYFLCAPGQPELPPNGEEGFNDPDEEWPEWIDESDLHRYHKVDVLGETSLVQVKAPSIDSAVQIAIGGSWDEIDPMYQAEYPFNEVHHTHGGIYTEMDNTEGERRYHIYHPSNSYMEIGETGNMTFRNADNRWDIVDVDRYEHTMNAHHRTVEDVRTSLVKATEYEEIKETCYQMIHENHRKDVYLEQEYYIVEAEILYLEGWRSKYIGDTCFEYITLEKTSYVGADVLKYYEANCTKYIIGDDLKIVDGYRTKHIVGDEIIQVDQERNSWVSEYDLFECDGYIHLKAAEEIILEAPTITFRADVFDDLAAETNIAGDLTWNGIANGWADSATYALEAVLAESLGTVGEPVEFEVTAVEPELPEIPASPEKPAMPEQPPEPEDIPPPPPPPLPPPYEYEDVPPEIDECE